MDENISGKCSSPKNFHIHSRMLGGLVMADITNCTFSGRILPGHSVPICPKETPGTICAMNKGNTDPKKIKKICRPCKERMKGVHEARGGSLEDVMTYADVALVETFLKIGAEDGKGLLHRDAELCSREVCTSPLPPKDIEAVAFGADVFPLCPRCRHPAKIAAVLSNDPVIMAKLYPRDERTVRAEVSARIRAEREERERTEGAAKAAKRAMEESQIEEILYREFFPEPEALPVPKPFRPKGPADLVISGSLADRRGARRTA
jgi:hypothetical protein